MTGGILSGGILARGDFVLGGFCPGGFCPGGLCPGGFCPGGFCPVTGCRTHVVPFLHYFVNVGEGLYLLPSGSEQHEVLQVGSIQGGILQARSYIVQIENTL